MLSEQRHRRFGWILPGTYGVPGIITFITEYIMFQVTITDEMLEKLRSMLEDEDEEICVRLREYKVGSG